MLFWDKGGRATVEIGGAPSRVCTSVDTSRPFLATNGTGDESRSHGSDAAGDATAAHRRLTGGPWVVEDIAGMGMIDYARVTLDFGEDGRLSGDASCNRYTTRYTAGQGRLEIEDGIALTRRLCPEALMNQESLFVDTLGEARRFSFDSTDALLITGAADGATILARRR